MHSEPLCDNAPSPEHRLGVPVPQRVAVFRALQLGDMLCAVPALRALRAALPEARITLVGLPWAEAFARRFGQYVDDFLAFPGAPGLPERTPTPDESAAFEAGARAHGFDLAIQLHGSGRHSNPVALKLSARHNAGFFRRGESCPDPGRFMPYPDDLSEVQRLLQLMAFLGIPAQGEALEFPLQPQDWLAAAELKEVPAAGYVCVHPGARAAARRWSIQRFAVIGDVLAANGWPVVLTGTAAEAAICGEVRQAMRAPCVDLAGRTMLGSLAAVVARARLVICNDTGISHIAAALRVPSVVIFTASDPRRWAPLDGRRHRPVFHAVGCRPCSHAVCPIGHPCATGVTPHAVLENALALLNGLT